MDFAQVDYGETFLCEVNLTSNTFLYQHGDEEATTGTELKLPQLSNGSISIEGADATATTIMMVWEPSDLVPVTTLTSIVSSTQSPVVAFTSQPAIATASAASSDENHSALPSGTVAAISTAASMSVILLVAAYLFHRSWRRRRSNKDSQFEANVGNTPDGRSPGDEPKAEMEDPISARFLFKQSGAYRGKPELGSGGDKTHISNPDEADRIHLPSTQYHVTEDSLPREMDVNELGQVYPAELE